MATSNLGCKFAITIAFMNLGILCIRNLNRAAWHSTFRCVVVNRGCASWFRDEVGIYPAGLGKVGESEQVLFGSVTLAPEGCS